MLDVKEALTAASVVVSPDTVRATRIALHGVRGDATAAKKSWELKEHCSDVWNGDHDG